MMNRNHPVNREYEVFVPTLDFLIDAKLEMANLCPNDIIFDLGCGDGRVLIKAAQKYNIQGVGVDVDEGLITKLKEDISSLGLSHLLQVKCQDFAQTDLSKASVLLLYLTRNSLGNLSLKLENELRPGTKIITHHFDLPAWTATEQKVVTAPDGSRHDLYLYIQS